LSIKNDRSEIVSINPYREFVASISPTEFEVLCLEILNSYAEVEQLLNLSIQHNVHIPTDDGIYQIDIYASSLI